MFLPWSKIALSTEYLIESQSFCSLAMSAQFSLEQQMEQQMEQQVEESPSTSSMADDIAADVLSSLLNPSESPNDPKKKGQRGTKTCKKSSEIWDHYRLLNENQNVECAYCWKVLKRNDSSTKSMWGHMTAFHQNVLDDKQSRKKLRIMAVEPLERKKYPFMDVEVSAALRSPQSQ